MAHVLEVGDILQVSFVCNLLEQYAFNVLNFYVASRTGATVTDDHAANQLSAEYAPLYKDILSTSGAFAGVKAQVVFPLRWDPQVEIGDAGAGVLAGDMLPSQACGLVAIKTGIASRQAQGRIYFPATSEAQNTNAAKPGTAYLTGLTAIMVDLATPFVVSGGGNTATLEFGVWSRVATTFFPMTEYFVRDNWATQRKRSHIRHDDTNPF